ncbi:hypothetical protein EZS27_016957 [termite gut metagenome]|uniref:AAA+ ATPase domain-containing protein n=1 Tax=termite gut metagenome TaxID=433724 RepID=A0A5J4RPE5_9ZZZZ
MSWIKRVNELEIPTNVKMMVYGQPGAGKTTYALSAPSPILLLDFDNGVRRIDKEHLKNTGTVQIPSWQVVLDVLSEDLTQYKTIVIDTIGKMMDYIIAHKCGARAPRVNDWNGINAEFSTFVRRISELNINIIFVAHRDTRREGDDIMFIPTLREKTYNSILTELDLLGYIEMRTENGVTRRTVTFEPTSRNDGKNTCNLPFIMEIPMVIDRTGKLIKENNTISKLVIEPYVLMLQLKKAETEKYENIMKEIQEQIELVTDEVSANDFVSRIDAFGHVGSSKAMAAKLIQAKALSLGLTLNKSKLYEKKV